MMRAMILAAGLGQRMQPLTANCPKPLLKAGGKSLIEHQLERLAAAGVTAVVINHFYRGAMIRQALGDGARFGLAIAYSRESVLLGTAGGIIQSLPLLPDDSFIVVNADIWADFAFSTLVPVDGNERLAHLVMVPNAAHHPAGDFYLDSQGRVQSHDRGRGRRLTFSGISVLHKKLFAGLSPQPRSLVPLLRQAMATGQVSGEVHDGQWLDVGTPARLQQLNRLLAAGRPLQAAD